MRSSCIERTFQLQIKQVGHGATDLEDGAALVSTGLSIREVRPSGERAESGSEHVTRMASTVRLALNESATLLEPCYDIFEQSAVVRLAVTEAELVSLCEAVKSETGFSFPSPVALSSADKAALRASDAQTQQTSKPFFPFMSSFMATAPAAESGGKGSSGSSSSAGAASGGRTLSSANRDALEARRAGWEGWLGAAYANERVVETSEALVDFACAHETRELSKEDSQVARSARRRRLVAEAKAVAEAKGREALKTTLRSRENEVAREIGKLEVKAAQLSRSVAALRIRRQALAEFVESRLAWREQRFERREASLAQRARLREELATAEKAAAAARQRAAAGRDRRDAEAAAGAAAREAVELECDAAAAALRAAQDEATALEERAARCRGRLGQRAAEAEAAEAEAARAAEARRWVEQVELPRCEADRAAAAKRRRQAEHALSTHKRAAATRAGRLGVELARRHDERDAVESLAKLLDLSQADADKRLGILGATSVAEPGLEAEPAAEAEPAVKQPTGGFEQGAVHVASSSEPSSASASTRRRLVEAYSSAVRDVEGLLDESRRADADTTADLEAELEAARSAETALARVAASALDRRDVLRDSARRAARAAASALAAKDAAKRDLEDCLRRERNAKHELENAQSALDAKLKANKQLAVETSNREKQLRHALDADAHVAVRLTAAASSEADALALARGRLLDADDGDDNPTSIRDDVHQDLGDDFTSPALAHGPPDVLDLAKNELDSVDLCIAEHEQDKSAVRNEIATVNANWESESVALRAKLHGADCQLRIFRDEAQAAMRMQRDVQDNIST